MFVVDFTISLLLEEAMDWLYGKIVSMITLLLTYINEMGAELFELPWASVINGFFEKLGWTLYVVGIVVAAFEFAIEFQNGRGNIKDLFLNILKGFMSVELFSVLPISLYRFSVEQAKNVGMALSGIASSDGMGITWSDICNAWEHKGTTMGFYELLIVIMVLYSIIKVFFENLKRGGIIMIQIAVGSLYMFSVPRGYIDGFVIWIKQVIGICLTAFMQTVLLIAGLMTMRDRELLGIGIMLASTEVPRIAGQFGLDTSTKANVMSGVYAANMAFNMTKTIVSTLA